MRTAGASARIDAVVIGASAGGIEALSVLLPVLLPGFRAAVLVVVHLPRERPSLLADIFTQKCAVPVIEAVDKEPVMPGTIAFAPPDYHLLVDEGPQLSLSADALVNFSRPSVDVLFESAADVYGTHLMGIILTGGNSDGAAGLEAIRRVGGMAVVQQPETAQTSLMPASALQRVPDAQALPLDGIATLLRTLNPGDRP
ncbi:chemotaxis protein CheB [Solimonas marina]|uniref:protein-glutamate methylesterase n=1 Tax=Solimonas marina TaxID=2714601 RepID=A0A969W5V2_9GAMM|nr:chemotaxis protein CheB [Solimonas marina]NKF20997.1 chemotaxis protein CheB [Solimonas marina]